MAGQDPVVQELAVMFLVHHAESLETASQKPEHQWPAVGFVARLVQLAQFLQLVLRALRPARRWASRPALRRASRPARRWAWRPVAKLEPIPAVLRRGDELSLSSSGHPTIAFPTSRKGLDTSQPVPALSGLVPWENLLFTDSGSDRNSLILFRHSEPRAPHCGVSYYKAIENEAYSHRGRRTS